MFEKRDLLFAFVSFHFTPLQGGVTMNMTMQSARDDDMI
jgi:hypothetical protein